jgi:hydrogenase expression/formation protein HypC
MCVAVPVQIVEVLQGDMLRGRVGGSGTELHLSSLLLPEAVTAGDYVIMHAGFALHKINPTEAEESLALFRLLAGAPSPR